MTRQVCVRTLSFNVLSRWQCDKRVECDHHHVAGVCSARRQHHHCIRERYYGVANHVGCVGCARVQTLSFNVFRRWQLVKRVECDHYRGACLWSVRR